MNKKLMFGIVFLALVLIGCDTIHPSGRLSPMMALTDPVRTDSRLERIQNEEIPSENLPATDRGWLLGKQFDAYVVGDISVQSLGAQWAKNVLGIRILVRNSGTIPWDIPLDNVTFVPKDLGKARHKVGRAYKPTIVFEYFGTEHASVFVVPEYVDPEVSFLRSAKSRWSRVHNAVENTLQAYYTESQSQFLTGDISSVTISPDSTAFLYLVFPVGFIESGELNFPVDEDRAVQFQLSESEF